MGLDNGEPLYKDVKLPRRQKKNWGERRKIKKTIIEYLLGILILIGLIIYFILMSYVFPPTFQSFQ